MLRWGQWVLSLQRRISLCSIYQWQTYSDHVTNSLMQLNSLECFSEWAAPSTRLIQDHHNFVLYWPSYDPAQFKLQYCKKNRNRKEYFSSIFYFVQGKKYCHHFTCTDMRMNTGCKTMVFAFTKQYIRSSKLKNLTPNKTLARYTNRFGASFWIIQMSDPFSPYPSKLNFL